MRAQGTIPESATAAGIDYCNRRGKRACADALAVLLPLVHSGRLTLAARDARNHAKALAHRGEAPRLGDSELDSLVESFGLVADGDVSLAAGPGVEG